MFSGNVGGEPLYQNGWRRRGGPKLRGIPSLTLGPARSLMLQALVIGTERSYTACEFEYPESSLGFR